VIGGRGGRRRAIEDRYDGKALHYGAGIDINTITTPVVSALENYYV
jgi:hypothetical protein